MHFIDDIFLIWSGTKTEFDDFFKKINECHPSIKFEYEMPKTEINFLDDNKRRKSYCTKKGIVYTQALRFNEICYNRSDLHNNCNDYLTY